MELGLELNIPKSERPPSPEKGMSQDINRRKSKVGSMKYSDKDIDGSRKSSTNLPFGARDGYLRGSMDKIDQKSMFNELGSQDDKHLADYNFSLSLSSSIQGIVGEYVSRILTVMDHKVQEIEKPLSADSSDGEQEELKSVASSVKETKKKFDPEALAAMSNSESASFNDFNKEEGNAFTGICTDIIDQKIRGVLRSTTGMDGIIVHNNQEESVEQEQIKEVSDHQTEKRLSLNTLQSSQFSQGVVEIAHNYLCEVYDHASRTLLNGTPEQIGELNKNEIEFVRVITEQSLSSEHSHTAIPKMAQDYLGGIFNKCEDLVDEAEISELSFDLTDEQILVVQNYVKDIFHKSQKEVLGASKYFWGNDRDIQDSDPSNEGEGEEYFPAPSINVIEDKTEFNVTKLLNGVKQEGYDDAGFFPAKSKSSGLKEKARKMSSRLKQSDIKALHKMKEEKPEEEDKNKDEPDEDYFAKLMLGSFPDAKKEEPKGQQASPQVIEEEVKLEIGAKKDTSDDNSQASRESEKASEKEEVPEKKAPSEKPVKRKMKINKQATLVKNTNLKGAKVSMTIGREEAKGQVHNTIEEGSMTGKSASSKPAEEESKSNFSSKSKRKEHPKVLVASEEEGSKPKQKLPPLKKIKSPQGKNGGSRKGQKPWVTKMPPSLGHNIRKNVPDLPDFDEQAFCIYSVFREKILDKIIREELKEVTQGCVKTQKKRQERIKIHRNVKSSEFAEHPRGMTSNTTIFSPERGLMKHNFKKEIIKKKHMLDLMMQKKMSKRKKKIIKVYGKDMLAEMYLDLLNVTEGEPIPKRILSPLSGRLPRNFKAGPRKKKWNNDKTLPNTGSNFKMNSMSIFNIPNTKQSNRSSSRNKRTNQLKNQNSRLNSGDRSREEVMSYDNRNSVRSGGSKSRRTANRSGNQKRFNRTHISPDPGRKHIKIFRK